MSGSGTRYVGATRDRVNQWSLPRSLAFFEAFDGLVIVSVGVASGIGYNGSFIDEGRDRLGFLAVSAVVAAIFVLAARQRGLYAPEAIRRPGRRFRSIAAIWALTFLFLSFVAFGLKIGADFSRGFITLFAANGLVVLCGCRALFSALIVRAEAEGLVRRAPSLLIGPESVVQNRRVREQLVRSGYDVRHSFAWAGGDFGPDVARVAGEAVAALRGSDVEEVILAGGAATWRELRDLMRSQPLPVHLLPERDLADLVSRPVTANAGLTFVEMQRGPLSVGERRAKRALDLFIGGVGLGLLLPLFVIVGAAIKIDSPGPVLFRQTRHGFNGRKFKILKFRSMFVQEDGADVRQASQHDGRVTPIGRWLRRSSIDELPQLLNVLRGEMSIVGPRPHAIAHDTYYDDLIAKYAFRHHVKPGLTGWAQVNGCRGETPKIDDMAKRVEYDIWYVDNFSVALDIRIMLRTCFELVRMRNAY